MKKILLMVSLLLAVGAVFGQTLYSRKDTLAITQDSVTLQAGQFRGNIQWQHSLDGKNWNNLERKTQTLLRMAKSDEGYYRAQLTDGTCLPTYSDTAVVVISKTHNDRVSFTDHINGATFIDRDDSVFTYIGTHGTVIPINTILIDDKQESDIRVVSEVTQSGDTLKVKTEPGTLEDLFINQEFKLSTEMIIPTKSAYLSTSALAKAMKGSDGFIHPVEVIDHNAPASNLKSAQINEESLPSINFTRDFSGETMWSEEGASIIFEEAFYKLGAELNYEFKFEQEDFDWKSFKFPKGKLTKFKICTDKEDTGVEAKMLIKAVTSHEISEEETKVLRKGVFNKTFKYLVFVPPSPVPIPFWSTVRVDLIKGISFDFNGEACVSGGTTGNFNLELGASYENGAWTTIKPTLTPKYTLEGPEVDAKVDVQAMVEVYPHVEVTFYSALAPYLDIAPYVREEMEYSLQGNFKYDLYSGVNARLGVKAEVLGEKLFDYKTDNLNLCEKTLYTGPKKVQVVSGANQKGTAGKPLPQPIVIKVLDSKDMPVKNAVVNFKASMGKLFKVLLSSPQNAQLKSARLFASATDSTQLAVVADTTGQVSINYIIADTTAAQKLIAYLKDGKDSIIKESIDTIDTEACGCDTTKFKYFTDSRDGHVYKSIEIGAQTWMAENLAYLPHTTPISTSSHTEPCYYVYDDAANGVFYNWPAAVSACPAGWHLPSDAEWTTLSNYLGGESVAGGKMKSITGWNSPNTGATNESCFSALPSGFYDNGYAFYSAGNVVGYWSSSFADSDQVAWDLHLICRGMGARTIGYNNTLLFRTYCCRNDGLSVRCIKD